MGKSHDILKIIAEDTPFNPGWKGVFFAVTKYYVGIILYGRTNC